MMFAKAPEAELEKNENFLWEALHHHQMIHMEAYVVHVDMISRNEVVFKLTPETIESLVDFHKEVYSVDAAANTYNWSGKHAELKKLQEEFVQAANKFVYRTSAQALEGLEEDGAGELLSGRSEEAKAAIAKLFVPLTAPPPPMADIMQPVPILSSSTGPETWWQAPVPQPAPHESWKVLPPSPNPATTGDSNPNLWASLSFSEAQLASPTPSYSQPFTPSPFQTYACMPTTCMPTTSAAISAIPLSNIFPSMLVQPCSTAVNMGMGGFGWGEFASLPYGTIA